MRTFLNFTIAIALLLAAVGSGAFFVMVSKDLKLKRVTPTNETSAASSPTTPAPSAEEAP